MLLTGRCVNCLTKPSTVQGAMNLKLRSTRRLVARGGVVTDDVRRRLIPALEKLRMAKSARTSEEAVEFIARAGLLTDRQSFIDSLRETDEAVLNATLMHMIATVRVDPLLTPEIWAVLARARTENLALTCLRYRWLFALPAWEADKTRLLAGFLERPGGGAVTNVDSALNGACHVRQSFGRTDPRRNLPSRTTSGQKNASSSIRNFTSGLIRHHIRDFVHGE